MIKPSTRMYLQFNSLWGKYHLKNLLAERADLLRTILMYHGVGENSWAPFDIPEQALLEEIDFYQKQGYSIVSSKYISDFSSPGPVLAITFDDGNRNALPVLKNLIKLKIPFTIAICPAVIDNRGLYWFEELLARIKFLNGGDFQKSYSEFENCKKQYFNKSIQRNDLLDKYRSRTKYFSSTELRNSTVVHDNLDWGELRELVDTGYCSIASHTLYHDAITVLEPEDLKQDLTSCNERIEQELNVKCQEFVCPFGGHDESSLQTVKELGYKCIYLANNKVNMINSFAGVLNRLKGLGCGNFSGRYFEYMWLRNHQMDLIKT